MNDLSVLWQDIHWLDGLIFGALALLFYIWLIRQGD